VTRQTSRQAYEHLVANNLLVGKQAMIIAFLTDWPGGKATSGEVIAGLKARHPGDASLGNVNAWRARFTELRERGLIVEAGERRCAVTGRRALVWRFTGRTEPFEVKRVRRGAKAWKALAMDLWADLQRLEGTLGGNARENYAGRIRALGGKP
jgi:hypothetical protein